jgi:hypothetical protein
LAVSPVAIPSGEAVGTPVYTAGGLSVLPGSIPSGEVVSTVTVQATTSYTAASIASAEVFGDVSAEYGALVSITISIESEEAFGSPEYSAFSSHLPGGENTRTSVDVNENRIVAVNVATGRTGVRSPRSGRTGVRNV